eukprot:COSAG01_NODE_37_length_34085_cov_64.376626_37_plen_1156_part_00
MRRSSQLLALCIARLVVTPALAQSSHRPASASEVVPYVNTYATDGISGYTTYETGVHMSGMARNCYTQAGTTSNPTSVPAARQVATPFGVNTAGTNPAYWPYNAECRYDSWLTAGKTDGSSGVSSIGIDFNTWTETQGLVSDNGAIFWMAPEDATPARAAPSDPQQDVVLAHLTIATGTLWSMTIGKLQGRSVGALGDWVKTDARFSNAAAPAPAPPPPAPAIAGCMDPVADNYNPLATSDAPSTCIYPRGCMDRTALNFDPLAMRDDGSCEIPGCIDSTASNFNTRANVDDGLCIFPGCTNSGATNYDPRANQDDNSCVIPPTPPTQGPATTSGPVPTIEVYASQTGSNHPSPYAARPGKTTYRLRMLLNGMQNLYTLFGDANNIPHVPAAWFHSMATSKVEPPDAMMYTYLPSMNEMALTSFLSVGPDYLCQAVVCSNADHGGRRVYGANLGEVGTATAGWNDATPLTLGSFPGSTTDFAVFWMNPLNAGNYSAYGGPLIAQLTLPDNQPWFVRLGVQGKIDSVRDWRETHVVWVHPVSGTSGAMQCPLGMTGTDCLTDVDECASNPCARVTNLAPIGSRLTNQPPSSSPVQHNCYNGVNEWACLCRDGSIDTTGNPAACGSWIPPITTQIPGCMDSTASNYDPTATVDDGHCRRPPCQVPTTCDASNYAPVCGVDNTTYTNACEASCATPYTQGACTRAALPPPPPPRPPQSCVPTPNSRDDGSTGNFYCINGGTIGGTTGSCTCTSCNAGYSGSSCQTADACVATTVSTATGSDGNFYCVNGGTIGGTTGSCTCSCAGGYTGTSCEIAPTTPTRPPPPPPRPPQSCVPTSNSRDDGSTGNFYCINGGTIGGTTGSCTCSCAGGYTGVSCEIAPTTPTRPPPPPPRPPQSCVPTPNSRDDGSTGNFYCINGGTIGGTTGSCTCTSCNAGYSGSSCQTADACVATTVSTATGSDGNFYCVNGGTIGGTTGSCTCSCAGGYTGTSCEIAPTTPTRPPPPPPRPPQSCVPTSNSRDDGSTGNFYCINGGTIGGTTGSCTCSCAGGYTGDSCEIAPPTTPPSTPPPRPPPPPYTKPWPWLRLQPTGAYTSVPSSSSASEHRDGITDAGRNDCVCWQCWLTCARSLHCLIQIGHGSSSEHLSRPGRGEQCDIRICAC